MPPAARRMLATKSKPKPRFSEEDRKKARERLKRLEQEAHDAKLAAELQRKQFDKDFGDNSDDDDRRPNPSASGSGIPRDSQGRAIEPDRRGRSRSRHERPAPEKPPKRGRHKEPEKPERPVTPPRGPKHKKEGDKGRGKDKGSKGEPRQKRAKPDPKGKGKAKAGYWGWIKSIGYFWVPGKAKGKGTEKKKGKEKGKPKSKTWHGSQAEWVEEGCRGRDPPEEYHHEGDDEEGDAPPDPDMGYRGRGGYDDDDDDGGDDDDDDGGEGWWPEEGDEEEDYTDDPVLEPPPPPPYIPLASPSRKKGKTSGLLGSPSASPPCVGRRSQGSEKASEKASVGKVSRKSSETDWDPRKGPAPAIRCRSGAPPAPPPYEHNPRDLRSFPRWERRLKLWEKRVLAWMPAGEAAMLLLESLTGIAELETEHLALEKVNCETGIQPILDALRAPLSERSLYLKRLVFATS